MCPGRVYRSVFSFLLDDDKTSNSYYYSSYFTLLALHLSFTLLGRLVILNIAKGQLENKIVQFNAVLVGNRPAGSKALSRYRKKHVGRRL
jgi:hypothetical protein